MKNAQDTLVRRGRTILFDTIGSDGRIAVGKWDRFTTWGAKQKDGMDSRFDEETLPQMVRNWKARGDLLALDYNHQSSYAPINGQPAPALAWYSALAVVREGQLLCFETLDDAIAPPQADGLADGMWGYRSEVTPLGHELLANFKYISPTFTTDGQDEQGNSIGYVIHAVAATNTPFQSGTGITFQKEISMATKFEQKIMGMLGLEAGADDDKVMAAYSTKMDEARECLESGEPDDMKKMAGDLEELASHHEAAFGEEGGDIASKMRGMASRLSKLSMSDAPAAEPPVEAPTAMEEEPMMANDETEAKMETSLRQQYSALAARLNVRLPAGANSKQMFDAISAATVSASQIPSLVEARVKAQLMEQRKTEERAETARKAKVLVEMAVAGGYPEAQKANLLSYASDPKSYAAAEAMVEPFIKAAGGESVLFQRMTGAGTPVGADPRREGSTPASGRDRRVVRNDLATFVVEGERFSQMAKEWADAKDGPIKMEIDGLLSDSEQAHSGFRLIAANRLLKQKRPDLWAAAEEQDL